MHRTERKLVSDQGYIPKHTRAASGGSQHQAPDLGDLSQIPLVERDFGAQQADSPVSIDRYDPRSDRTIDLSPVKDLQSRSGDNGRGGGAGSGKASKTGKNGKPKRKHRGLRIALIVIVAIIVALLVAVGVYLHTVQDKIALDDPVATAALTPAEAGQPSYTLVLGSDWRENSQNAEQSAAYEGDSQRTDVMLLLRIDPSNKVLTMVTIPRDTPVQIDGRTVKINEAYNLGGAALTIQKVEELTGVKVSHVVIVHFSEFQSLIDALGGITVNVPQDISYTDAITGETVTVSAGKQTLDGQHALIFARVRKQYDGDQDMQRQSNVRDIVMAVIDKVRDTSVFQLPGVGLEIADCVSTDYSVLDLVNTAMPFMDSSSKIYTCTGPYEGDIDEATGLWLCYENPAGWAALMQKVDAGVDPNA